MDMNDSNDTNSTSTTNHVVGTNLSQDLVAEAVQVSSSSESPAVLKTGVEREYEKGIESTTNDNDPEIVDDDVDNNDDDKQQLLEDYRERDLQSSVQVAVRVRPLLAFEQIQQVTSSSSTTTTTTTSTQQAAQTNGHYNDYSHQHHHHHNSNSKCVNVLKSDSDYATVIRIGGSETGQRFTFDRVYDSHIGQCEIYNTSVAPLLDSCLQGYNATILAYGQTGSGKTHTMMGPLHPTTTTTSSTALTTPSSKQQNQLNHDNIDQWNRDDTYNQQQLDDDHDDYFADAGIMPRAFRCLFDQLENKKKPSTSTGTGIDSNVDDSIPNSTSSTSIFDYQVSIQFLELYGEEIRDLLVAGSRGGGGDKNKLTIRDLGTDEPEVVGATQNLVATAEEALLCLQHGMLRRVTGATAMNESSSRSHAILTILIEQQQTMVLHDDDNCHINPVSESDNDSQNDNTNNNTSNKLHDNNHVQIITSRFNFVDLAGSERQKRTLAIGKRLKEGIDINKGLLVLGNVISALGDPKKRGKTFVPYRDSKLTRLLKGSLGGNHRTLMIACISPASSNMEESLNCLRYANRAKNIQNNAIRNVDSNSKMISELQTTVQVLSSDLVRILNTTTTPCDTTYPREVLDNWASGYIKGGQPTSVNPSTSSSVTLLSPHKSSLSLEIFPGPLGGNTPVHPTGITSTGREYNDNRRQQQQQESELIAKLNRKIDEMEIELSRTQEQLRSAQRNHDASEEELYVIKAQKELSDLQLSVLRDKTNSSSTAVAASNSNVMEEAFVKKSITYETEIRQLRNSLEEAQTKISRMTWAYNHTTLQGKVQNDDAKQIDFIEQAAKDLELEKTQLFTIQTQQYTSASERLDDVDEELEDEAHVEKLTKKYIPDDDDDEIHDVMNDDSTLHLDDELGQLITTTTPDRVPLRNGSATTATPSSVRERRVQADLAELSRSIASKENLINQLKLSQEKYASMRDFYEERLRQMEQVLNEKEQEREALLLDLKRVKESGNTHNSKEIEEKLGQKEKHIADLRKRKQELVKLTAVSSRNDLEISRLHNDVQNMKRLKVELQKKLADERKAHVKQMKELEKNAIQKDRELSKMKRITNKREVEAIRANQIAKQRMDELAQLRLKYKDSEKKLRMASLKRGVLAKAGIDNVIVGRRERSSGTTTSSSPQKSVDSSATPSYAKPLSRGRSDGDANTTNSKPSASTIGVDSIRSYFDTKVAGVVRKEAIADKLAREWEEHFDLSNRKQELLQQKNTMWDNDELDDAHQALLIQIQFKEERIRRLASKLTKSDESPDGKQDIQVPTSDSFLFGKEFASMCKGTKPDKSHVIAARVLFGMIVRERRRVAALARTASSLDERVQAAERAAELSEAALRSYMEDQRNEISALTQNQQEHILSLMDMVKDESFLVSEALESSSENDMGHAEEMLQRKLLVLSNERVVILERQIQEMQTESAEKSSYCEKLEEMKESLSRKLQEYEDVQKEALMLRDTVLRVRDLISKRSVIGMKDKDVQLLHKDIVQAIREAITPVACNRLNSSSRSVSPVKTPQVYLLSRSNRGGNLGYLSDSDRETDEVDDTPEWANDIMADLALIAMGKLPPSMENTPAIIEGVTQLEKISSQNVSSATEIKSSSVFDRLADPKQWTGTQKQVKNNKTLQNTKNNSVATTKMSTSVNAQQRREARKLMTKEISSRLEKISVPTIEGSGSVDDSEKNGEGSNRAYPSVFDRLVSPSHYTGTQKEKFQETKQKRERTADQVADRLLDGILYPKEASGKKGGGGDSSSNIDPIVSRNHSLYTEYARQDVFERLQKTTTQAFAVKTHPNALSAFEGNPLHHQESTDGTTKSNSPSNEPQSLITGDKNVHSEYMRQDVFQRLQRTTTEAYAKKTNSRIHHHEEE